MMNILPDYINLFKTRGLQLINSLQRMSVKSLQTIAKQALDDYQKDGQYLSLRTRYGLLFIKLRKKFHKPSRIKDFQIMWTTKQNSDKTSRKDTLADRYIQIRKTASEITRKQLIWTTFVSVVIGGILAYLKGFDSGAWPWWGYFLVGLIGTLIIGLTIIILYNCKCAQKLEDQEAKRLQEKNQVNLNELLHVIYIFYIFLS